MLGTSGRRSPGVRTLIPDEEAAVLAACSRCSRYSLPSSTAASSRSGSHFVTPNDSEVPEDFSVVGVLDSPLGVLLLYCYPHSLDRYSGQVTDIYNAHVKKERSRSNEDRKIWKTRQKRALNKSEFKHIRPFSYVDIKWLLQLEERHTETSISGTKDRGGVEGEGRGRGSQGCGISIPNKESPKGKAKKRVRTEEVVERVAFLENTMVVITKTNLRVTILAAKIETADVEVEVNRQSYRGLQESISVSEIERSILTRHAGNSTGIIDDKRSRGGSGYIGNGTKEKFLNPNAAADTSKRRGIEDRGGNEDEDEKEEVKIIGGTIFTSHLKGV